MRKKSDWLDDFMLMEMLEEEEGSQRDSDCISAKALGWGVLILLLSLALFG